MRLDKHYNNANLEARRQDLLRRQQADNALRKYKVRKGSVRSQVDAAFAGGPTGELGAAWCRASPRRTRRTPTRR